MAESTTAPDQATNTGRPKLHPATIWRAFRRFRRTRPFWGCLTLALGGYLIARPLLTNDFTFYAAVGTRGLMPVILGGGMIAAALVALVAPAQRHFPAIIAAMLAVAALPMANLGGWVIGTLLGIIGAGSAFAWTPYSEKQIERSQARAAEKARKHQARRSPSPAPSTGS